VSPDMWECPQVIIQHVSNQPAHAQAGAPSAAPQRQGLLVQQSKAKQG
jgi:hypothetical protein